MISIPVRVTAATAFVLTVALILPTTGFAAKLADANASVFLGQKKLDGGDTGPVDNQAEWGVIVDLGRKDSIVNLVLSYLSSNDKASNGATDYEGETWELGIGIRKPFRIQQDISLFLDAGVAYVDALYKDLNASSVNTTDSAFGVWLGGGVNFAVGDKLVVGVLARNTSASATLMGREREVGGVHFGITAGLGF
jgi:hypothetical protein